jgi:hypothetical protein
MAMPKLTKEDMKGAITKGVYHAFWQMITNATDAPCADFYDFVKDGVEKAMSNLAANIEARLEIHIASLDHVVEELQRLSERRAKEEITTSEHDTNG